MHYSVQLITTSGGALEPIISEREFSGRIRESHDIEHIIPRENKADDYVLGYLPVIATKEFLHETRDKDAEWLGPRIGDKIMFAILIMSLYLGMGEDNDVQSIQSIAALLFFIVKSGSS